MPLAKPAQVAPSVAPPRPEVVEISQWDRVAAMDDFKRLLKAKSAFVVPATLFFVVYYFLLPFSVGYYPAFMSRKVWGQVNIAYLFALSQFFVSWAIAWLYVRAARGFDDYARRILDRLGKGGK